MGDSISYTCGQSWATTTRRTPGERVVTLLRVYLHFPAQVHLVGYTYQTMYRADVVGQFAAAIHSTLYFV